MNPGAVLVDIGGGPGRMFRDLVAHHARRPHLRIDGVVHYCVANMPGAVPTSTYALNNTTRPYVMGLAGRGVHAAVEADPGLASGVNVVAGQITCAPVADAVGLEHVEVGEALASVPAS